MTTLSIKGDDNILNITYLFSFNDCIMFYNLKNLLKTSRSQKLEILIKFYKTCYISREHHKVLLTHEFM